MLDAHQNAMAKALRDTRVATVTKALPGDCRKASTLRKECGSTGREIADRLRMPAHAVEELLIQAAHECAGAESPNAWNDALPLSTLKTRATRTNDDCR